MANLKTDYKDDVLDTSVNEKRKWIITENGDGTVTIADATTYLQVGDLLGSADLNAITLAIKECFQSVSDGKALVASAITDKKVATDATATFATMAANIRKIVLGSGNATVSDVLSGKTFTNNDGVQYTGTLALSGSASTADVLSGKTFYNTNAKSKSTGAMANNGAVTKALDCGGSYTIPKGYHSGSGKVTANSLKSQTSASAVAANITSGKTAWVNGVKITGTRPAPVKSLSGSVTFTVAAATSSGSVTTKKIVNFPSAFDSVPTVKVVSTTQQTTITTTATNVTKSSFTINAKNNGMYGSNDIKFEWSAEA